MYMSHGHEADRNIGSKLGSNESNNQIKSDARILDEDLSVILEFHAEKKNGRPLAHEKRHVLKRKLWLCFDTPDLRVLRSRVPSQKL